MLLRPGNADPSPEPLPRMIELTARRFDEWPSTTRDDTARIFHTRAILQAGEPMRQWLAWRVIAADSVWVGMPLAFGGIQVMAKRTGDTLRGTAIGFTDSAREGIPSRSSVAFAAHRVSCPA